MVLECNKAETGVGATMAPKSQSQNGNWAALVKPAMDIKATGAKAANLDITKSLSISIVPTEQIKI